MQISTQNALKALDTNKKDQGLTLKEISVVDADQDGALSSDEAQKYGITSQDDLNEINQRYTQARAQGSAKPTIDFKSYGLDEHQLQGEANKPQSLSQNQLLFARSEFLQETCSKTLFPEGVQSIQVNDIPANYKDGSTHAMAILSTLAAQRPVDIAKMIKETDKTYEVQFPNGQTASVSKIDGIYQKVKTDWVNVLREAINSAAPEAHNNRFAAQRLLSTASFDDDSIISTSTESIKAKMETALANGKIVIIRDDWLGGSNSYAVVGYNAQTQSMLIKNLSKNHETANGGLFENTVAVAVRKFDNFVFEQ